MRRRFDDKRDASEKRLLILQMSECSVRSTILYFTIVQNDAFVGATHLAIFGEIRDFFILRKRKLLGNNAIAIVQPNALAQLTQQEFWLELMVNEETRNVAWS